MVVNLVHVQDWARKKSCHQKIRSKKSKNYKKIFLNINLKSYLFYFEYIHVKLHILNQKQMHRSTSYIYISFSVSFFILLHFVFFVSLSILYMYTSIPFFSSYMVHVCTKKLSWHLAFLAMLCEVSYKYLSSFCSCCLMWAREKKQRRYYGTGAEWRMMEKNEWTQRLIILNNIMIYDTYRNYYLVKIHNINYSKLL